LNVCDYVCVLRVARPGASRRVVFSAVQDQSAEHGEVVPDGHGRWIQVIDESDDRGGPDGPTPRFQKGDLVAWIGPENVSESLFLAWGHPGVVGFPEPMSVIVSWIDKDGWFNHEGVFQQEWLQQLSQREFERRKDTLRSSDWPGFPPGEYGSRYLGDLTHNRMHESWRRP